MVQVVHGVGPPQPPLEGSSGGNRQGEHELAEVERPVTIRIECPER